ncbi:GNAT family N-acetyltransferase [Rhodobacter sp. 24-YEA-8]|uniref:GNAT family N-acetyltransferase n=1 Tax=Rhodobacter sp. 24-YEA-8 TaxID=1884310 RepID=UPI00089AF90C|nr:GNAT family protein [Rhodobacter sp. 24-YEA-8]SED63618.1 Protein N-acetyltransferase, RimJ/RimL family [Rhodobacter sp. 24-YEA-8]
MQPIETERLILRNFQEGDAEALFAYLQAPVSSCFLDLRLADLAAARAETATRSGDDQQIAVALKGTGQLIGDLFPHPEAEEPDTVSIGWNFNPAFAGRGFALEAARALFDYFFSTAAARRLYACVEDHKTRSRQLCEGLGMRQEGTFVEFATFTSDAAGQPIYENTMQYALLRREQENG